MAPLARVAVVQTDPAFGEVARNLEAARALLADVRVDLVVLPELFATGYQFASRDEVRALAEPAPGGPTVAALEEIARATGATVVGGLAEAHEGAVYNAAAVVYPSGFLTTYRKAHLFFEENDWFAPGPALPPVIRTPQGPRVGVMICFDWYFPEVARHLALQGADVIAHPANLVLPHCPGSMPVRCLENRVFAATANRVGEEARGGRPPLRYIGRSQIVAPLGERLAALGEAETGVGLAEIDIAAARSKKPTARDDLFAARRADLFGEPLPERSGEGARFAVLRHDVPGEGAHHDLLFEVGGRLVAFRAPASLGAELRELTRAFDHRRAYLDFEGDLGRGRGAVTRVEGGTCRVEMWRRRVRIAFRGGAIEGELTLREVQGDAWTVDTSNVWPAPGS